MALAMQLLAVPPEQPASRSMAFAYVCECSTVVVGFGSLDSSGMTCFEKSVAGPIQVPAISAVCVALPGSLSSLQVDVTRRSASAIQVCHCGSISLACSNGH